MKKSSPTTTFRFLSSNDKELEGILTPGNYLRTPKPDGYIVRLPAKATPASLRTLARGLSHKEREQLHPKVDLRGTKLKSELLAAFIGGLILGTYAPGKWKSESSEHPLSGDRMEIEAGKVSDKAEKAITKEVALAETQLSIIALVDAPANMKRPQDLAAWAVNSGETHGYQVKVLDKAACEKEGLGALLAVNRGSEDEARFIIMEYKGKGAPKEEGPTVIIGKGITFDTGGVSIKPSTNLHLMKSDMGGAAATFGAMEAAARLKLPVHLIGIVPSTDNSVDAMSYKPSDVITGHSGKTIEIIDTDAEGRMVMSDGLSYAVKYLKPKILIDVATLTGSAVRTFGYECGAMMSKNNALVKSFTKAGTACGERVWPLPTWDDYMSGLDSDVADIKNYSGRPINGAIDAFKFLEFFTGDHPAFIHFDIAGVALKQGPYAKDRQATGFGMRLFVEWLERNA
ncbi:leucyl aminopeptidase family protein [Neolewinella persica]|uniref:leucyl aminopeptidase family protein n=1 Tax=Neolewinella persica TaxID=70998 RepID=UPI00038046A2|nr:leucyl aminopeptidase family protein [Neolewinella persica]